MLSNFQKGGTDASQALLWMHQNRLSKYNRVVFITDEQCWDTRSWAWHPGQHEYDFSKLWWEYKNKVCATSEIYIIDVAGYGHGMLDASKPGVYIVSGWSDKVFEMIDAIKNGESALEKIKAIEI
jgi:hypothetical protein